MKLKQLKDQRYQQLQQLNYIQHHQQYLQLTSIEYQRSLLLNEIETCYNVTYQYRILFFSNKSKKSIKEIISNYHQILNQLYQQTESYYYIIMMMKLATFLYQMKHMKQAIMYWKRLLTLIFHTTTNEPIDIQQFQIFQNKFQKQKKQKKKKKKKKKI